MFWPLYPGERTTALMEQEARWTSGHFGEEIALLPLPGFEPRTVQHVCLVAYQLLYSISLRTSLFTD